MKQSLRFLCVLCLFFSTYYLMMMTPTFYEKPWMCFAAIGAVILLWVVLGTLIRRRRFVRRLKKLCRARGLDLELHGFWRMSFVVRTEAGTFAGVVAPSVFRWIPIIFDNDGKAYRHIYGIRIPSRATTRRVRVNFASESRPCITRSYACYIAPRHRISFPGNYLRKFVIVNPMPLRVMVGEVQKFVYADNGERIADYTLYSGGAFCDYLDRRTVSYSDAWAEGRL